MTSLDLRICGWRFVPHSYALVNQYQCLELLDRPGISLCHRDVPFPFTLKPGRGLMSPADENAIWSLARDREAAQVDVEYRISWPPDFRPANAVRLIVFASYEGGNDVNRVMGYESFAAAHGQSGAIVVTPSNWSRDGLVHCGGVAARLFVVPHGIDPAIYKPLAAEVRHRVRRGLGIENRFAYLSVGAMTENKGVETLLKAFAAVARSRPDALLLLKGTDQLYASGEHLRRYLSALRLENLAASIRYFGGIVSCENMAELYNAADAYVTPYYSEGFNLPALEAAACGLPIIATGGGPTDDFTDQSFAWRIESRLLRRAGDQPNEFFQMRQPSVDHLIQLMLATFDDRTFRDQAKVAGPAYIHDRFSWSKCVDRLLTVMA